MALLFTPGATTARAIWQLPMNQPMEPALFQAAFWLADNTPVPSNFLDTAKTPAYGVMTPWGEGGRIVTLANRPVMATPFQGYLDGGMFRDGVGWYLQADPEAAWNFLRANRLRYVLVSGIPGYLRTAAFTLGSKELYRALNQGQTEELRARGLLPVSSRLWDERGSGTRHFRMVWEGSSPNKFTRKVQPVRIFEAVPGARLKGRARPGETVAASLTLVTEGGERFSYRDSVATAADGTFELILPYAAPSREGGPATEVWALGAWEIDRRDGAPARVEITEAAVAGGEAVPLP